MKQEKTSFEPVRTRWRAVAIGLGQILAVAALAAVLGVAAVLKSPFVTAWLAAGLLVASSIATMVCERRPAVARARS